MDSAALAILFYMIQCAFHESDGGSMFFTDFLIKLIYRCIPEYSSGPINPQILLRGLIISLYPLIVV